MTPQPSGPSPRPDPLFVLGAPRSGTTFLQQVIDAHPEAFITDELRAVSWLVQEAGKLREGRTVHGNPYPLTHGRVFSEYLLHNAGRILVPFYLQQARRAGKPAIRYWGDKYPHYDEILHLLPGCSPRPATCSSTATCATPPARSCRTSAGRQSGPPPSSA